LMGRWAGKIDEIHGAADIWIVHPTVAPPLAEEKRGQPSTLQRGQRPHLHKARQGNPSTSLRTGRPHLQEETEGERGRTPTSPGAGRPLLQEARVHVILPGIDEAGHAVAWKRLADERNEISHGREEESSGDEPRYGEPPWTIYSSGALGTDLTGPWDEVVGLIVAE